MYVRILTHYKKAGATEAAPRPGSKPQGKFIVKPIINYNSPICQEKITTA